MSELTPERIKTILNLDQQQRLKYLCTEVNQQQQIWLLVDEHGCVMLNTDDEDCVPVWPNKEFAKDWATDEWSHCQPESISLEKWKSHWTQGLEDDQLSVVAFPDKNLKGIVLYPEEFEYELHIQTKKKSY